MSEIIIIGATGVVGWRSVRRLVRDGHRVTAVTRSLRGRRVVEGLGARSVTADVFDTAALRTAFAGTDVVVNLLTSIPSAERMLAPGAWDANDRLRREASAAIARAAAAAGATRLVQESLGLLYADGGDRWLDEHSPVAPAGPAATALTAERNAAELFGGDVVVLRFGIFMGPDSALTAAELDEARAGVALRIGRGAARVPTVWLDDAAAAVAAAIDVAPGVYNVVDDDPPTREELEAALAVAAGRSELRVEVAAPAPQIEPLARSLRLSNRRLRAASAWAPAVRAGLDGWARIAPAPQAA
jgi:UDP-glucose 4-epimerase